MNKSIDILKKIYKPYRYTIKGNVTILETKDLNLVIKDDIKDIKKLFNYLSSRSFYNYPNVIDDIRKDIIVYEYINDINYPKEQRASDLIKVISSLHYKTSYFKDVTEDNYKKIYEDILNNINYLDNKFDSYYDGIFKELYISPSKYLFIRNYSMIKSNLKYCKEELDNYYELVRNLNKSRVSIIHNNLSLDHFLKSDKDYLISWDNYQIDTPILDLVKFYRNEYLNINFDNLFKEYLNNFNLLEEEKKLFFILISIPFDIDFNDKEFNLSINIRKKLDYIYKTEKLIRPYNGKDEIKEN